MLGLKARATTTQVLEGFLVLLFLFWRQALTVDTQAAWNSLCGSGWPQTHRCVLPETADKRIPMETVGDHEQTGRCCLSALLLSSFTGSRVPECEDKHSQDTRPEKSSLQRSVTAWNSLPTLCFSSAKESLTHSCGGLPIPKDAHIAGPPLDMATL